MPAPQVLVPNVTGLRTDAAAKVLRREGLTPGALRLGLSREHDVGVVTDQMPPAGTAVGRGTEVTLVVSTGRITPP